VTIAARELELIRAAIVGMETDSSAFAILATSGDPLRAARRHMAEASKVQSLSSFINGPSCRASCNLLTVSWRARQSGLVAH